MSEMPEWKPLHRKIFAFIVPERNRIAGSILYQPQANRGSLSSVQDIWILSVAKDCRSDWKRGDHCFITDGFEAEPVDLDLWDEYRDRPEFAGLRAFVESVEGKVKTTVVHEDSVLGIAY